MKLLNELFAPDSNFKPVKLRFVGRVKPLDSMYEIYDDSRSLGIVIHIDNQYRCRFSNWNSITIREDKNTIVVEMSKKTALKQRRFNLVDINMGKIINLVRGDFQTWNEIIQYLDLVEIINKETRYKINFIIPFIPCVYYIFSDKERLGWITYNDKDLTVNMDDYLIHVQPSSKDSCISVTHRGLKERLILPRHVGSLDKLIGDLKGERTHNEILKIVLRNLI